MTAFTGTINGGLTASNATVTVKGPVNGGLNLQAGSLVNASTINGSVTMATNTTLNNQVWGHDECHLAVDRFHQCNPHQQW